MYEDHRIEERAFLGGPRVFCIASAGCTAFALCPNHDVVACDINPTQVEYVQRRLAGGGREVGSAERVLALMRRFMPLAGWRRRKLAGFLGLADPAEQLISWRNEFDNWRFRTGLALLLSPLWLRSSYSSPLLSSLPPRFDRIVRARMERCFEHHPNRDNPYAWALLMVTDPPDALPELPRLQTTKLELVVDDAAAYLERCPRGSFTGFSLSNILDGARPGYRQRLFAAVRHAACPEAHVVLRSFGEPPPGLQTNQAEQDRSMLWGVVDVRTVEAL
jgi:S-adenosylmethionine:diacylglycerol 3-amino-3-carboxypropyl transferase